MIFTFEFLALFEFFMHCVRQIHRYFYKVSMFSKHRCKNLMGSNYILVTLHVVARKDISIKSGGKSIIHWNKCCNRFFFKKNFFWKKKSSFPLKSTNKIQLSLSFPSPNQIFLILMTFHIKDFFFLIKFETIKKQDFFPCET